MRLYLDANVVVSLFAHDALTTRAERLLADHEHWRLVLSDFACAEFSAVIRRRVRTGEIDEAHAQRTFSRLDHWAREYTSRAELQPSDIVAADVLSRRPDLSIRTPDAIHVAVARRIAAPLATFDVKLAENARIAGLDVLT